jgi:hypothetical protein
MSDEAETAPPVPASATNGSQDEQDVRTPEIPVIADDEPTEEERKREDWVRLPRPVPVRLQANFTALAEYKDAEDVLAVFEEICQRGEERGLFFEFSYFRVMEDDEILAGTPIYHALTGEAEPQ